MDDLHSTPYQVIFCQEHKLRGERLREAKKSVHSRGWRFAADEAVIKETMPSGGVGIIAKRYLDFWWDPLESNIVDGRVSVAFVR